MSAQHTDVTAGADPALTAGSSAGQAKIALPGNLGKDVAGEQAGAGSGDQLASHPLLSLVADVLPADATVPEALVDQLARKRRKKKGALHVSGTVSCFLQKVALGACSAPVTSFVNMTSAVFD